MVEMGGTPVGMEVVVPRDTGGFARLGSKESQSARYLVSRW